MCMYWVPGILSLRHSFFVSYGGIKLPPYPGAVKTLPRNPNVTVQCATSDLSKPPHSRVQRTALDPKFDEE